MAAIDFSQFHELAEQFKGEIPLKQICEQEGVSYRSYIAWRSKEGISPRRRRHDTAPTSPGMVEVIANGIPPTGPSPMTTAVHIEFANGLKFDRTDMEVDALIEFLTGIRGALCLV